MSRITFLFVLLFSFSLAVSSQSNTFTYQGKLTDGANPANGIYLMQFSLFDAASGGNQIGQTLSFEGGLGPPAIQVTNGIFSVQLDFGVPTPPFDNTPRFDGSPRWIQIAIRKVGEVTYTPLSPRQPITSDPYAIRSATASAADTASNATTANNALSLGGVAASQFVVTTDPRMTDARIPIPGSTNYIQNGTTTQASSNFNVSGNGTVGGTLTSSKLGVGVAAPLFSLHVIDPSNTGLRVQTNGSGGTVASFGGNGDFVVDAPGVFGGRLWITEAGDTFIGANTSGKNLFVNGTITGNGSGLTSLNASNMATGTVPSARLGVVPIANGGTGTSFQNFVDLSSSQSVSGIKTFSSINVSNNLGAGAITVNGNLGAGAITVNNNLVIGTTGSVHKLHVVGDGAFTANVGIGTATPNALYKLDVEGTSLFNGTVTMVGALDASTISTGLASAGNTSVCVNSSLQLSVCSSSLRYKTNIAHFSTGLSLIQQLRPITFDWKQGGVKDVGFGAENVANIDPLFVTYNKKGEVEGVKYDRLSAAFVNAFKEQQAQIDRQQKEIEDLKGIVLRLQTRHGVKKCRRRAEIIFKECSTLCGTMLHRRIIAKRFFRTKKCSTKQNLIMGSPRR